MCFVLYRFSQVFGVVQVSPSANFLNSETLLSVVLLLQKGERKIANFSTWTKMVEYSIMSLSPVNTFASLYFCLISYCMVAGSILLDSSL